MSPPPGKDIVEGRYQNEADFAQFAKSDAIVLGTPTYMGGPAAQFKAFADAADMVWFHQGWKNKLVGGFTHSSSSNGDKGASCTIRRSKGHPLGGRGRVALRPRRQDRWRESPRQLPRAHGSDVAKFPQGTPDSRVQRITSKNHYVFNLAWLKRLSLAPGKYSAKRRSQSQVDPQDGLHFWWGTRCGYSSTD